MNKAFYELWQAAEALQRELSDAAIEEARSVWGNANTSTVTIRLAELRRALTVAAQAWPAQSEQT